MKPRIGNKIKIKNQDGQYTKWADKVWEIDHIAYSGVGYDTTMKGSALVSCKGLPVSLYEYEFTIFR
jgi:hypothetical protein